MKSDLYTKIILTVIAVCLIAIVFKDHSVVTPANASPFQSLIESGDIKPNYDGSINVRIVESKKLDVNVDNKVEITTSFNNTIPVEIKRVNSTIPVEIKRVNSTIPVEIKDARTVPVEVKNFPR